MDWLKSLYPEICELIGNTAPEYWPGLKQVLRGFTEETVVTEAFLPLACCRAVGGNPRQAIYISASIVVAVASLRIFDDTADQDRPGQLWEHVGPARAWNYGSAIQVMFFDILNRAPLSQELIVKLNRLAINTFLLVGYGQDRDMSSAINTFDDYWLTVEHKNAYAFSFACMAGAMAGTNENHLIGACARFGYHLGLAVQVLNDMDSIWSVSGQSDLQQRKITLPLLYALELDHGERDELRALLANTEDESRWVRIKEILEKIDTRSYLTWVALTERDRALEALAPCPDVEGRSVLESYITGMFDDVDEILADKGTSDK
jgi:geranylgeranyl pyrophosphate synthase